MKVLVLGSSGFVGLNYLICSRKTTVPSSRDDCNVTDHHALRKHIINSPVNIVIYAAGCKDVKSIEKDDSLANCVNNMSAGVAAKAALDSGKHFIYISTDYVYEGSSSKCCESIAIKPYRKYSITKARGEDTILSICDKFTICRMSGACGVACVWMDWLVSELSNNSVVEAYINVINTPISMADTSKYLDRLCETKPPGIFNLSGHNQMSRYSLFTKVRNYLNRGIVQESICADVNIDNSLVLDNTKIVSETRIHTEHSHDWICRYASLSYNSKVGIDRHKQPRQCPGR